MAINFLSSINLNQNQLIKAAIENQPGDIAAGTGVEGQVYFDTSTSAKVLKVWNGTAWVEVGGGVTSLTATDGTFINLTPNTTQSGAATLLADLSATGTPDNTKYLRGDNTWSAISGIYSWSIQGGTGGPTAVPNGTTITFAGGTNITTALAGNTLTINHGSVSRSDTTSSASPAFGGTFTVVDSVTSSAEGHVTALNLKTVTLPTPVPATITLTGDVTGSGTTSIATTIAAGAVEFSMMDPVAIVTSSEGIASNNNDVTLPTSAAVKAYVDASTVGAIIFQGGYDAATNTPNLDVPPTGTIKKGFMWTVTVDGLFFGTEQLRVGDSVIAEVDSPTTLADWTTVQGNIDLATLTTVGIGNVNAGTGIDVVYASGTATVSAQATSYATPTGISVTSTVIHNLGTKNVIVQLYDSITFETIYTDVTRPTVNTVLITFATNPINPVIVLVQK